MGSARSTFELAGIGSVRHEKLLKEGTPVAPLLLKPCRTNRVQYVSFTERYCPKNMLAIKRISGNGKQLPCAASPSSLFSITIFSAVLLDTGIILTYIPKQLDAITEQQGRRSKVKEEIYKQE